VVSVFGHSVVGTLRSGENDGTLLFHCIFHHGKSQYVALDVVQMRTCGLWQDKKCLG